MVAQVGAAGSDAAATHRARLAVEGAVSGSGEFDVLAITAGEGNGWTFPAAALQNSLALWDGAECFIDHAWNSRGDASGRSLRDLAGQLTAPTWDAAHQGIRARLKPVGPSAALLAELGRQLVREPQSAAGRAPRVGFSADVVFTAQGRQVTQILRVLSVDLVFNPARGGAFLRALNHLQEQGSIDMDSQGQNTPTQAANPAAALQSAASPALQTQLSEDTAAIQALRDAQQQQNALAQQAEAARQVRAQMCGYLLDSGLAAARLPAPVTERIRKQFAGQVFEPAQLTQAIDDARALLAELTGPGLIQGPGRIQGMYSSEDQFSAAVFDLLGAERPQDLAALKTAKLSGIRELYTLMTGDCDFVGGYHPTRAQFASTGDLPAVLKNAMNKLIVQEWQELGRSGYRWWEPIVSVEHFNNLQQITGVLVGEVAPLPSVAEGAAYAALSVNDSAEVGAWNKYGGYIGLTLEMFERDETHRLRQYPKKLASAGLRRVSALVGSVFTSASGVGPTMADTSAVFAAGHNNLGTAALSSASWEAASAAIYNQSLLMAGAGAAPKLALDAKYALVPRSLRLAAMQILYPNMEHSANIFSENMQKGQMGDVITCPEMSDANDWAAVADPRLAPGIIIGERFGLLPEIIIADGAQNGALFTNDEIRMKARHWLAVFVADYRPLYKSNVANS
jgi:hypothetical protein